MVRLVLADWNSYWLDELYSVAIYGIWNDSAAEAIRTLAESVHPPLYQFLLYHWMNWFGDSEIATRTLSNLYVTLATLFLYLTIYRSFGKRLALTSAIAFSLMNATMLFGLETRSYAQTIFLATISSFLLLRLMHTSVDRGWRGSLTSWTSIAFVTANAALLLTHFYNALFLGAQGLMALIFVLRVLPLKRWHVGAATLTALYGVPGAAFAAIWGSRFAASFNRSAAGFQVGEDTELRNPLHLLADLAGAEMEVPAGMMWIGLAVGVVVIGTAVSSISRSSRLDGERRAAWATAYLVGWLALPLALSYVAFSVSGVARYSPRYFLFSVIPLAPLTLLAVEHVWHLARRMTRRVRGRDIHERWLIALQAVAVVALFIPGTIEAAVFRKTDWRGAAQSIVAIAEADPESSYAILEPAFRRTPVIDYYLDRYSNDVIATGTIRRGSERAGGPFSFEVEPGLIRGYDYLILPFVHHRVSHFPLAVNRLKELYPVHLKQIDRNGHGLMIFRLSDAG